MSTPIPKEQLEKTVEYLKGELKQIRTGRAHPSLVENIKANVYEVKTPLIQLASISVPEPRQIVIQPWDKSIIKSIEKAIQDSELDLNPQIESDNIIRINIPPLNEERRESLVKLVNQKAEEAKVSVRNEREELIKQWKEQEKNGEISEDELFSRQKELQEIVDQYNEKIKKIAEEKKEEILKV